MYNLPPPEYRDKSLTRWQQGKIWTLPPAWRRGKRVISQALILEACVPVPESGCWLWLGTLTYSGYGTFKIGSARVGEIKHYFAHRESYRVFKGEVGDLFVCHKCDVRSCVNPDHLFLGTQTDNMRDMVRKGRCNHERRDPRRKLNAELVSLIKAFCGSNEAAARKFGVSATTTRDIRTGKTWRNIK